MFDTAPLPNAERIHGEVMVSTIATIFKKLKLDTHENLGWGQIHLPEIELQTTAWWLAVELDAVAGWRREELDRALVGAGRALQTVASVLLMSDPHDLGLVAQVRSPHAERPVIYLYETVPGGVGLSPRLFDRTDEADRSGGRPDRVVPLRERLPGVRRTAHRGVVGQAAGKRAAPPAVGVAWPASRRQNDGWRYAGARKRGREACGHAGTHDQCARSDASEAPRCGARRL